MVSGRLRQNLVDGVGQIAGVPCAFGKIALLECLSTIACLHQPRGTACGRARLKIAQRVAYRRHAHKLSIVALRNIFKEPR